MHMNKLISLGNTTFWLIVDNFLIEGIRSIAIGFYIAISLFHFKKSDWWVLHSQLYNQLWLFNKWCFIDFWTQRIWEWLWWLKVWWKWLTVDTDFCNRHKLMNLCSKQNSLEVIFQVCIWTFLHCCKVHVHLWLRSEVGWNNKIWGEIVYSLLSWNNHVIY